MAKTVTQISFAFGQMEGSGRAAAWLSSHDEPLWLAPWAVAQARIEKLLNIWTASKTMAMGKVFLHVEHNHNYGNSGIPGERYLTVPGSMTDSGEAENMLGEST
jgi:hypothetical protein